MTRQRFPMPHFLGIGAMRSGTSWLATHLGAHPSIWLKRKEIHFFDRKIDRRLLPLLTSDTEARLRYGLRFLPGWALGRVIGEYTPAYAILSVQRIRRVHDWMPGAKLLFIMRDPVERAWSQAKHDLSGFLGIAAEEASEARLRAFFDSPGVRRRGDYAGCLANWLRCYGREQLLALFLEDVVVDPEQELRRAFTFLGVNPEDARSTQMSVPVHRSAGPPPPDWAQDYLLDQLRPQDDQLEVLVGRRLPWRSLTSTGPS